MGCAAAVPSGQGALEGEVHLCWANGNIESISVSPKDTINDLRLQLAAKHDVPAARIKLVDSGALLSGASAAALIGQTITAAVTPVTFFQASISKVARRPSSLPCGFPCGTNVISKLSFEGDEGTVVSEGDVGIVTGPGMQGLDDLTVDFPTVKNVGMRLDQVSHDIPANYVLGTQVIARTSFKTPTGADVLEGDVGIVVGKRWDQDVDYLNIDFATVKSVEVDLSLHSIGRTQAPSEDASSTIATRNVTADYEEDAGTVCPTILLVHFSDDWLDELNKLARTQVHKCTRSQRVLKVHDRNGKDLGLFFNGHELPELRKVPEPVAFPLTLTDAARGRVFSAPLCAHLPLVTCQPLKQAVEHASFLVQSSGVVRTFFGRL